MWPSASSMIPVPAPSPSIWNGPCCWTMVEVIATVDGCTLATTPATSISPPASTIGGRGGARLVGDHRRGGDRRRPAVVIGGRAGHVAAEPSGGDGDQDEPGRRRQPVRAPAAGEGGTDPAATGGVGVVGCATALGSGRPSRGAVGGRVRCSGRVGQESPAVASEACSAGRCGGDVGAASGCRAGAPGKQGVEHGPGCDGAVRRRRERGENRVRFGRPCRKRHHLDRSGGVSSFADMTTDQPCRHQAALARGHRRRCRRRRPGRCCGRSG